MRLFKSKEIGFLCSVFIILATVLVPVSSYGAISGEISSNSSLEQCGSISPGSNAAQNVSIKAGAYSAVFFLNWSDNQSKLGLQLTDPNGIRYDQNSSSIEHDNGDTFDYFLLQSPAYGVWTAEIIPKYLKDNQEHYCLMIDQSIDQEALGKAKFNGILSNTGIDSDYNDIYDAISVNVGIDVYKAGLYTITGSLYNLNGSEIWAATQTYLDIGAQNIYLDFSDINSTGKMRIGNLTLYNDAGYTLDHVEREYATRDYNEIEQGSPVAKFTGNYSDNGIDVDGNGIYDLLEIVVGMHVHSPGEFTLTGTLHGQKGEEIAWSIDQRQLSEGYQQMQLDFDGKAIGRHGASGPYQLRDLLLASNNWSMSDLVSKAYNTSSYNASQFAASG
jgi:hypothetical protein